MGRKPKASKSQIMKEPLVPKSPLEGATNVPDGNLDNIEHGAPLPDTSPPGKNKSKASQVFTRRSQRIQPNSVNQVSGPVVQEIISETENNKEEREKDKEDETRVIEAEPKKSLQKKSLQKKSNVTIKSCRGSLKVNMQEPAVTQVLESVHEIISETENNQEECDNDKEEDETRVIEVESKKTLQKKSLQKKSNVTIKSCRGSLKVNMQEPAVNHALESVHEIISETENNQEECDNDKEEDETRVIQAESKKSLQKKSNVTIKSCRGNLKVNMQEPAVNQVIESVHEIISETENNQEECEKDKEDDETRVIEVESKKSLQKKYLQKKSNVTIKSCRGSLKVNMQEPVVNQVLESVHEIISETENNQEECEKDKEDDETRVIEVNKSLEKISNETDQNSEEENLGATDLKYKAMYINSQRKIESLMEENRELNKLLEHAVGKIDVFEKQSSIFSEVMNVFASLSKVNENLSQQVKRSGSYDQNEDGIRPSKKNKVGQGFL